MVGVSQRPVIDGLRAIYYVAVYYVAQQQLQMYDDRDCRMTIETAV